MTRSPYRALTLRVASLSLILCTPLAGQEAGAVPAPPVLSFLVGEWQLEARIARGDGGFLETRAELAARPILDGLGVAIEERFPPLVPGRPVFTEASIYYEDPKTGQVEGASVNSLGNRKLLGGEFLEGDLVLIQTGELFGGRPGKNRLTWSHIQEEGFELRLDAWDAVAEAWKLNQYSYTATRRAMD